MNRAKLLRLAAPLIAVLLVQGTIFSKGANRDARYTAAALAAQTNLATLSGTVVDQGGAAIKNARVAVVDPARGLKRQTTTDENGYFSIPLLPPSTYTVTVEQQGFAPSEVDGVVLNVGDQRSLHIQMKVGQVGETVTVNAASEPIRQDATVATVVDRQFVANMPLNGRSLQSLIALTPGVTFQKVPAQNALSGGQFSVNGQRPDANYFTVDGVSANAGINALGTGFAGESASGALPGLTALGGTNSLVSIDALQEFKIQTSTYAPEFGRMPGGQISLSTRSGTNGFHGDAFDYLRNDVMDANDWFANNNHLTKAKERQNDFGGVIGGPIIKDRTFFFFSYEGLRLRQPVTSIIAVPTLASRQIVPAAVKPYLDAYPIPNGPEVSPGLADFAGSYSNPATLNAYSIRIDHSLTQKFNLFGTYKHSPSQSQNRGGGVGGPQNLIGANVLANDNVTAGLMWLATNTVTNDLRFNWTRVRNTPTYTVDNFGGAVVPAESTLFQPPLTPTTAFFFWEAFTGTAFTPNIREGVGHDNLEHQINVVDTLSWTKGAHQLKFGFDYRRITSVLNRTGSDFDAIIFNISPQSNVYLAQIARGAGENDVLFQNFSAFAQDTWNVSSRLTLTYGLRWDAVPTPSSLNGHDPTVLLNLGGSGPATIAPKGTRLFNDHLVNLAPRFGISYQLSRRSGWETVLRGGSGVFYDIGLGVLATEFDAIYPYFGSAVYYGIPFPLDPNVAKPPVLGVTPPQQFWVPARDIRLPYTVQWNASVEQSLGRSQTLTISYVGSAARRLLRLSGGQTQIAGFGTALVPYELTTNESWSNYDALQVQFQRRLSRGVQALISYTLGRSYDTSSGDDTSGVPPQVINLKNEYAPSDFDVRHTISGALTVDLPHVKDKGALTAITRNWGIDALERFRTAFPTNLLAIASFAGVGSLSTRPNILPGVPLVLHGSQYPGGKAINTAAIVAPPPNTLGNFPRNSLRFFNASQLDMAVRRQFGLSERFKLQLRMEFFNIFNHPNFADPAGITYSPPYNVSKQTLAAGLGGLNPLYQVGGPRSGQVSLKLLF